MEPAKTFIFEFNKKYIIGVFCALNRIISQTPPFRIKILFGILDWPGVALTIILFVQVFDKTNNKACAKGEGLWDKLGHLSHRYWRT